MQSQHLHGKYLQEHYDQSKIGQTCILEDLNCMDCGIALDIDETLSWTIGFWVEQMQKLFGNPENLTVQQLITKYRYTQNVPYWQSKEALDWMEDHRNANDLQTKLAVINGAKENVIKISQIIPVVAYITTRPEIVREGTVSWLNQEGFPNVPVICRPDNIPSAEGSRWKASILDQLFPKIEGIIDDNSSLLEYLPRNYKGKIFLYSNDSIKTELSAFACPDWNAVYKQIKGIYGSHN